MAENKALRLLAQDEEDLAVISAAVQDSVLKAGNLRFDERARRFTIELNRFKREDLSEKTRVRAVLAFDSVLSVQTRAITKVDPDMVLSLLSMSFSPSDEPPGGRVGLLFAGDGELALEVEALDVTLLDTNYEWATHKRPDHERKRR